MKVDSTNPMINEVINKFRALREWISVEHEPTEVDKKTTHLTLKLKEYALKFTIEVVTRYIESSGHVWTKL